MIVQLYDQILEEQLYIQKFERNQMREPLQKWISEQLIKDEMLWKGAWGRQVEFVRDSLAPLVGSGLEYEVYEAMNIANVISTHRSKSIVLPVYELSRPDLGIRFILRNNFYNWKLSVLSRSTIEVNFDGLFHTTPPIEPDYTGNPLSHVYFEGFPNDLIFSYYATSDKKRFSAELSSGDEAMWTTIFLIMKDLGAIKPMKWHTKASHRAELGLDK